MAFLDELRTLVPAGLIDDPDVALSYGRDMCLLADSGRPIAVVKARTTEDVVATLKLASRYRVPVVPRGAGTGLAGAANAIDGGIVLSLADMDRILEIDPVAKTARVEPGVVNSVLNEEVGRHGLFYPPDPGSRSLSTLGGNFATNAGGMCCVKYGVTGDHVLMLQAVLADGTVIRTGSSSRKDVAGLDLTQLLVGSEGTLAVIVEAVVRLRELPEAAATVAATFTTPHDAIDAVLTWGGRAAPSAMEIMDRTTVAAVEDMAHMGLDLDAGAMMLTVFDGASAAQDADEWAVVARRCGALEVFTTHDPDEGEAFMHARRIAYNALEAKGSTLLDDVAVEPSVMPELLRSIEGIASRHGVTIGTFGHAADGNLHPTIVFDAADHDASRRARDAFEDILEVTLRLKGTITGEHGVGLLKLAQLSRQVGARERQLMSGIKQVFDPLNILNPGRGY